MRIPKAILWACLLLVTGILYAAQTAKLQVLDGRVQYRRNGEETWTFADKKTQAVELQQGDRVRTSNRSKALITMEDGSRIELAPSSVFLVDFLEKDEFRFKLNFGAIKAFVSKLRQRRFAVITPTAVCAVRGTEFSMSFSENSQNTNISVTQGLVSVSDNKGSEVMLAAGQEVQVTPEGLGQVQGGQTTQSSSQEDNKKLAQNIKREVGLGMSREEIEAAAALEIKSAVAQDGKTLIDVFGKRVRVEQYIARPASDRISWVVLNTRDDSFNHSRWDVWLNKAAPNSFASNFLGGLYFKSGASAPEYYALKDQWYMSNVKDYWIQARAGGNPVQFNTASSTWWETIFDHNYVAISEAGKTRLLEHYVPASGVKGTDISVANGFTAGSLYSCNAGAGSSCIDTVSPAYGNSPLFFLDYYNSSNNGAAIGTLSNQLQIISTVDVDNLNTTYAATEGYFRSFTKTSDLAGFHDTLVNKYGTVTSVSSNGTGNGFSQAATADGKSLITTYNDYVIDDDGKVLSRAAAAGSSFASFAEKYNFESVTESPTFTNKIDLVVPIRILNQLDSSTSRPSS